MKCHSKNLLSLVCPTSSEAADLKEYQKGLQKPQPWHQVGNDHLEKLRYSPLIVLYALNQQPTYGPVSFLLEYIGPACKGRKQGGNSHISTSPFTHKLGLLPVPASLGFLFSEGLGARKKCFRKRMQQWFDDV